MLTAPRALENFILKIFKCVGCHCSYYNTYLYIAVLSVTNTEIV